MVISLNCGELVRGLICFMKVLYLGVALLFNVLVLSVSFCRVVKIANGFRRCNGEDVSWWVSWREIVSLEFFFVLRELN